MVDIDSEGMHLMVDIDSEGMPMMADDFAKLLEADRVSIERYVRFRIMSRVDADDVLQEVYLAAYQKFSQLKNRESFKPWLISIARNKCNDYFRTNAARYEIPIDALAKRSCPTADMAFPSLQLSQKLLICWATRISRYFICTSGIRSRRRKSQGF